MLSYDMFVYAFTGKSLEHQHIPAPVYSYNRLVPSILRVPACSPPRIQLLALQRQLLPVLPGLSERDAVLPALDEEPGHAGDESSDDLSLGQLAFRGFLALLLQVFPL